MCYQVFLQRACKYTTFNVVDYQYCCRLKTLKCHSLFTTHTSSHQISCLAHLLSIRTKRKFTQVYNKNFMCQNLCHKFTFPAVWSLGLITKLFVLLLNIIWVNWPVTAWSANWHTESGFGSNIIIIKYLRLSWSVIGRRLTAYWQAFRLDCDKERRGYWQLCQSDAGTHRPQRSTGLTGLPSFWVNVIFCHIITRADERQPSPKTPGKQHTCSSGCQWLSNGEMRSPFTALSPPQFSVVCMLFR